MSTEPNTPPAPAIVSAPQSPPAGAGDARQVAHELANLLDGSLRNVSLAIDRLKTEASSPEAPPDSTPEARPKPPLNALPSEGGVASGGAELVRRLETASHGMRQMAAIVRQMMNPSAPPAACDADDRLGPAVIRTTDLLAPLAAQHGVAVEVSCDEPSAVLPAGRLPRIVENAVRNSIETLAAAGREGAVTIEVRTAAGTCELTIADDGPGFDAALLDEEGGFRFGRTTRDGGHGIGLTVARDVAEQMHGVLDVFNHPERGAVVRLRFPVAAPGEPPAARIVPVR